MKRNHNKNELHIKGENVCSINYKKCYERKICKKCSKCEEYKLNKIKEIDEK